VGKRVYEIAKELGVEAKQVVQRLKEAGVAVKDHLTSLGKEDEEKARKLFETPRAGEVQVKKMAGGRVVRRRAGGDAAAVKPAELPAPAPAPAEAAPAEVETPEAASEPTVPEGQPADVAAAVAEVAPATEQPETPAPAEEPAPEPPPTEAKAATPAVPDKKADEAAKGAPAPAQRPKVAAREEPSSLKSLAETPDRKKRRLIVDKRRDVISLRDYIGVSEEGPEPVEQQRRPSSRRRGRPGHQVRRGGRSQKTALTMPKAEKRVIRVEADAIQVSELAHSLGLKAADVIRKLMGMGVMASLTQALDLDTAGILAADCGYTIEKVGFDPSRYLAESPDGELELKPRSPVVTIMGHVDHGKTTLLDRIRNAHVAEGEAGGITQHIGAYKVRTPGGDIVFLDTPGHEAFTAMRARGAGATDIVILVVAADDGVMAQTKEAIAHARAAEVPIIVAVNKIDKPDANIDRVRRELADEGLAPEEWGGPNIFCEISAKQGLGIDALMEAILLQAEVLELKANPDKPGRGVVLEAQLDRTLGPVATMLVQAGTLRIGDAVIAGMASGRVRVMTDDQGRQLEAAGPAVPVRIAGLGMVPNAGENFVVMPDERKAKEVADWQIEQIKRARAVSAGTRVSLEDFFSMVQSGTVQDLRVIVRADVQGSLSPLIDSVSKLKHPEIQLRIIHSAVGNVTESDVNLAMASEAVIVGFNVGVDPKAQHLADQENVDIKRYSVIYDVIDDLKKAMEGLLQPKYIAKLIGRADVRQVFHINKVGKIAGCFVTMGHIPRGVEVRVVRKGETVFTGKLSSLKRLKDDVKDVKQGFECGIGIEGYEALEAGDMLEFYEYETVRESIEPVS
jgi:translation initiation factor IF-2